MVFILERSLHGENSIEIDPITYESRVTIRRGKPATSDEISIMKKLTLSTMETLEATLGAEFTNKPSDRSSFELSLAPLGIVAHELGTLPMQNPSLTPGGRAEPACLDEQLKVVDGICDGVYVCDLSCFPVSPEVNPTLTLAALAIRLSRHLIDRKRVKPKPNRVIVVNHSGSPARIRLSNLAGVIENPLNAGKERSESGCVDVEAGAILEWERKDGLAEALFVRKRDQAVSDKVVFMAQPGIIPAQPGSVTVIGDDY